jgi:hypothetical protein
VFGADRICFAVVLHSHAHSNQTIVIISALLMRACLNCSMPSFLCRMHVTNVSHC